MPSPTSVRVGASTSVVGAILVLCGAFLPLVSLGDARSAIHVYEWRQMPLVPLAALIILGMHAGILFGKHRPSSAWLSLLPIGGGLVLHLCIAYLDWGAGAFSDAPISLSLDLGFWLPLCGFLLSVFGGVITGGPPQRPRAP